jgi:hypothetical protein
MRTYYPYGKPREIAHCWWLNWMQASCEKRTIEVLDDHLRLLEPSVSPRRSLRLERRSKPRYNYSFPARVWVVDIEDQVFCLDCHVDNMSSTGLLLKAPLKLRISADISLVVRVLDGSVGNVNAGITGTVIRDQIYPDGSRGIAIKILKHCLL